MLKNCLALLPPKDIIIKDLVKENELYKKGYIKIMSFSNFSRKYQLGKILGRGNFGTTYKGYNTHDNQYYAIKQLLIDYTGVPLNDLNKDYAFSLLENFFLEIEALTKLTKSKCNNVMKLYEVIYIDDYNQFFFILELIKGNDVSKLLKSIPIHKKVNYVDMVKKYWNNESEFIHYFVNPLISGVRCIHNQRISHRDIKPANIMYDQNNKTVKIVDLGLACINACTDISGTPRYLSPEYLYGLEYEELMKNMGDNSDITNITQDLSTTDITGGVNNDIWSVGVSLYEILSGKEFPYEDAINYKKVNINSIPFKWKYVKKLISSCLKENYNTREKLWNKMTTNTGLSYDIINKLNKKGKRKNNRN